MNIKDVMSKDLIVGYVPGTLKDALRILAKHNVSGMPILKKGTKKVVGVITRSDIFKNADEEQLALIMSNNPHTVYQNQDVEDAARLLFEYRIHGLPVVNKRNDLVGVISPTDILRIITDTNEKLVEDYMGRCAVPVYHKTPIPIVMEIINITDANALPVLDDDAKLTGIVSDGDLFKLGHIRESISRSDFGMGNDEDAWTWEGIRDVARLYYVTSKIDLPPVPVSEVMITDVIRFFKKTPVCEIATEMYKHKFSQIPIVNSNDRLIGMITDIDLMSCIFKSP